MSRGTKWQGSLAESAMNGCCVPNSRRAFERWMMRFWEVSVGAARTCAAMPPWSEEWPKVMRSLRIATLSVLTLSPAEDRARMVSGSRQARLVSTFEEAGIEVIGLQECRLPSQLVVREGLSWSRQKLRMGGMVVACG